MKLTFSWKLALAAGLMASAEAQATSSSAAGPPPGDGNSATVAQAQAKPAPAVESVPTLPEGTPVVVVGQIWSSPRAIVREQKMQVLVGPAEVPYTVHLIGATVYDEHGAVIKPNKLSDKEWVRIEGSVMNDPQRIKAKLVRVLGKNMDSVKKTELYHPGLEHGYIMAVAASRETAEPTTVVAPPPVTIIGKVVDDTGSLQDARKIQVEAARTTWTLEVPKDTPLFDVRGRKISVHQIAKGQWIRAHGWQIDNSTARIARLQEIGPEEAYRASPIFRPGEPLGYVERTAGEGVRFVPLRLTGVVSAVDRSAGTVTVVDDTGQNHVLPLASVTIRADGKQVDIAKLQPGQKVTVEGSEISF
jgi:hypothetical protein